MCFLYTKRRCRYATQEAGITMRDESSPRDFLAIDRRDALGDADVEAITAFLRGILDGCGGSRPQ